MRAPAAILAGAFMVSRGWAASPWHDDRPLHVADVKVRTAYPAAGRMVEASFTLAAAYANPFDPRQLDATVRLRRPDGAILIQPAFFSLPYTRTPGGEAIIPAGPGEWLVRFTPDRPGRWVLTVRAQDRSGEAAAPPIRVEVAPSAAPGVIRRSPRDDRYFEYDDGDPYFPVGLNLCWAEKRGLADYDEWLAKLGAAGGSWARIWMIYWHLALEGVPAEQPDFHGTGVYNLANAWTLDELFRIADRNGVALQLCLDSFNELRDKDGFPAWASNPYARERGGPLRSMRDFWTDPEAKRLYRQKLRYLAARWGAEPNLFAWEFWNEVDGIEDYDPALVTPWHGEMARELKRLDVHHHLVTTSGGGPRGDPAMWKLPDLDVVQAHAYNLADTAAALSKIVAAQREYGKPVIVGEFGAEVDEGKWIESGGDPEGVHLATALWAVPFAGAAGTPMIWYWGDYVNRYGLWRRFAAVNRFLRGVDWPGERFEPVAAAPAFAEPPRDGAYRTLRIKPDLTEWGSKQGAFRVASDGRLDPPEGVSQYLYAPDGKPEFASPLVLRGDFKEAATVRVHVLTVSDRALLSISADGKPLLQKTLISGAGTGEWKEAHLAKEWNVYQNFYDRDYEARIPAGTKEIRIENAQGDWLTVGEIQVDPGLAAPAPPLDVYGLKGNDRVLGYVKHSDLTWLKATAHDAIAPCPPTVLRLAVPTPTAWSAERVEPGTGDRRPIGFGTDTHGIEIGLPATASDLALDLRRPGARPIAGRARAWRAALAAHLQQNHLGFWLRHAVDPREGFYGALDREGKPDPRSPRSLVQQSRIMWTFAAAHEAFPREEYREAAARAFAYLRAHFRDEASGGWFWSVSADGRPLDTHKHLYGQSFMLYALSEYARAFHDQEALALALGTLKLFDAKAHDGAHGGYREAWTREWAPEPKDYPIGPPDQKSDNTHLHLLESLTALVRVSNDALVRQRLLELHDLFLTKITAPEGFAHIYLKPDWTPVPGDTSYGHDVEEAWLLLDADDVLGRPAAAACARLAKALVDRSLQYGYDHAVGGLYEGGPVAGPATVRTKTWWAQAELLVGLLAVHEATGDPKYFDVFEQQLRWIFNTLVDDEFGSWYPTVGVAGKVTETWKASPWKGPYHDGRACMESIRRLGRLAR